MADKQANIGEDRHQGVIAHMREGYVHCRVLYTQGVAYDFEYLEVNSAFAQLTGLSAVVGKRASDVVSDLNRSVPDFLARLGEVGAGGPPSEMEVYEQSLGGWFSLVMFSPAPGEAIILFENVTARKRIEAELVDRDDQFRTFFDRAPIGKALTAPNGRIMRVNATFASLLGRQPDELVGVPVAALTDPADATATADAIQRLLDRSISTWTAEKRYVAKDGRRILAEVTTNLHWKDGRPDYFLTHIVDITARRAQEMAHRLLEERYKILFEHSPDGVFSVSALGKITSLNPAFEKITGWPASEWIGRDFLDLIDPLDRPDALLRFQRALENDILPPIELRVLSAQGNHRVVELSGFRTQLSDGSVEIQGMGRDITERRAAERMLREHAEIIAKASEGVMIVGATGEIEYWNRGAEEIFGWCAVESIGRPPEEVMGVDDARGVAEMRAHVAAHQSWAGELRARRRDGRQIVVHSRVTVVRDELGQPRGRLSFLNDITDQKALEEKLIEAQRRESLGMLAAGIAHDLNNVLAPLMFVSTLLRDSVRRPEEHKLLDTVETAAARGSALVRQILNFVRNTEATRVPVRVSDVCREIVAFVQSTFPKSIEFTYRIPAVPPVLANPTQLHQVLLNLCVNARDAMPSGGKLHLEINTDAPHPQLAGSPETAAVGKWVTFSVSDTGVGIPADMLSAIWTPFFTTKPVGAGTGIGLATVREIVRRHQGSIDVQSQPNAGTTFRVSLPQIEQESPASPLCADAPRLVGANRVILVVDDEKAVCEVIAASLRAAGFRVVPCVDGLEAERALAAYGADLVAVITDADMPRANGATLTAAIRRSHPKIKILAMSGSAAEEHGARELRELAHGFLLKPFTAAELFTALGGILPGASDPAPSPVSSRIPR